MISPEAFAHVAAGLKDLLIIAGGGFAIYRYLIWQEAFPRINFNVDVCFIGPYSQLDKRWVVEFTGTLENKGSVPHEIRSLDFNVRYLKRGEELASGGENINFQLNFPEKIHEGKKLSWIPKPNQEPMRIFPGVTLVYRHVDYLPIEAAFVLIHAQMQYAKHPRVHRADRTVRVPDPA